MKKWLIGVLLLTTNVSYSQDVQSAREWVKELASTRYWGRGYTKDGMNKAAKYLAKQFASFGLQPMSGHSYFQPLSFPVNTFPNKVDVTINGKKLVPGKDYIIKSDSRGIKTKGTLQKVDSARFIDETNKIIVTLHDKLTWSVAAKVGEYTTLQLSRKDFTEIPSSYEVNIQNKFVPKFNTSNVIGMVKGTVNPDSVFVISAHFDHLGGMGKKAYFPGANDNASGTSLLLGLARYYAANPQPYTIAFMCFAGEEAGLRGSKYYTENPLVPLKNIRFLLNLDLQGTGEDGITVVNATEFKEEYALLNKVNDEGKYLPKVVSRGKAPNSDHYWFSEKGVHAFFIYTMGGIKAYHDIYDRSETLPLNKYEDLFKMIVKFNESIMK